MVPVLPWFRRANPALTWVKLAWCYYDRIEFSKASADAAVPELTISAVRAGGQGYCYITGLQGHTLRYHGFRQRHTGVQAAEGGASPDRGQYLYLYTPCAGGGKL